ncbi:hypothetical protein OHV66_16295, partial [Acinetobacter baumannii]|nr:hypothetical protein [Acinetobacter baumannii]
HLKWGLIKMIFILNRNLKIKIDKNDNITMSFWNDRKNISEFIKIFLFCGEVWQRDFSCKEIICDAKCGQ